MTQEEEGGWGTAIGNALSELVTGDKLFSESHSSHSSSDDDDDWWDEDSHSSSDDDDDD